MRRRPPIKTAYWIRTLFVALLICLFGLAELMIRRQSVFNLYLFNKAVASTAIVTIALSYAFSAIYRFRRNTKYLLAYRRYFGIVGFGFALIHIVLVFLVSNPDQPSTPQFPFPTYFLDHFVSFAAAGVAFLVFSLACWISIKPVRYTENLARAKKWRQKLRYGYVGVLGIVLHATLLKYEGWGKWISTFDPLLPPLSLIIMTFVSILIVLKAVQLTKERRFF